MLKLILPLLLVVNIYASKLIKINLSKQKIYAIENGDIVFSGNVSTGKEGHRTPRGTFKIIDKEKFHISNKYPEPNGGAKMPFMHRLTNSGLAIHQGYLPGYPASHGCIRVSKSTAKKLWSWTREGIKVKIYGDPNDFVPKKHKKHYAKKRKHKKHYAKRRVKKSYKKRVYTKKRYYQRPRPIRHSGYTVVEAYDVW